MPVWIRSYIKFLIAACLVVSFCLVEADAQTPQEKAYTARDQAGCRQSL